MTGQIPERESLTVEFKSGRQTLPAYSPNIYTRTHKKYARAHKYPRCVTAEALNAIRGRENER